MRDTTEDTCFNMLVLCLAPLPPLPAGPRAQCLPSMAEHSVCSPCGRKARMDVGARLAALEAALKDLNARADAVEEALAPGQVRYRIDDEASPAGADGATGGDAGAAGQGATENERKVSDDIVRQQIRGYVARAGLVDPFNSAPPHAALRRRCRSEPHTRGGSAIFCRVRDSYYKVPLSERA